VTGSSGRVPMPVRTIDDKPSDTLVVVPGEGFWTGSSTLPHPAIPERRGEEAGLGPEDG